MAEGLSIITAVHNGLPMNRLYWESLKANTRVPFELILIDNHSTDGSERFFRDLSDSHFWGGVRVRYVRNEVNQNYPVSQNQGMKLAAHDILCFINNDVWLSPSWHVPFQRELKKNPLLVLSPCGEDALPSRLSARRAKRRWLYVDALSQVWKALLIKGEYSRLKRSLRWMYGDIENFRIPVPQIGTSYFHGIKGDTVIFHRRLLDEKLGIWDEHFEAADWHLYLSIAKKREEGSHLPLPRVLLDSYVHHFGRYSAKRSREPFSNQIAPDTIENFWGKATVSRLWWV